MHIKIKKHRLIYKNYKIKCCFGKAGIKASKKEGDLATPKGIFDLGNLYYRRDKVNKIKCKIKKKVIKKNMGWCDDSSSSKYNQKITFPFKGNAEKLYRRDNIYDLFINIKYNTKPAIKNKGSAIFLHVANYRYKPTKGCVAILKKDFLKILPFINKRTKIFIS